MLTYTKKNDHIIFKTERDYVPSVNKSINETFQKNYFRNLTINISN